MPITLVLAVGLDSAFLDSEGKALKAAGYFVCAAQSVHAAMDEFRDGDYDLVLVGQSVEPAHRERLAAMIRRSGSSVPVLFVGEPSSYFEALAMAAGASGPREVMRSGDLGAGKPKKPVARAMELDSERLRRAAG